MQVFNIKNVKSTQARGPIRSNKRASNVQNFSLDEVESIASLSATSEVLSLSNILVVQEMDSALYQVHTRTEALLDKMDGMLNAMLQIDAAEYDKQLEALRDLLDRSAKRAEVDPQLSWLLESTEVRAAVEIAKRKKVK